MKTRLAAACSSRPFSNGTEGYGWMGKWCDYCANDHGMHADLNEPYCPIIGAAMLAQDYPADWPEAWLPEPDDGSFSLPSRMVCASFQPCTNEGCHGDPGAIDRAERVTEVTAYWREHGHEISLPRREVQA